ncbi:MAG: hypothetical protein Q8M15_16775 [Bacteroidota bacterium]|nr:hypothetical protein [Bacteroidota bacterium]
MDVLREFRLNNISYTGDDIGNEFRLRTYEDDGTSNIYKDYEFVLLPDFIHSSSFVIFSKIVDDTESSIEIYFELYAKDTNGDYQLLQSSDSISLNYQTGDSLEEELTIVIEGETTNTGIITITYLFQGEYYENTRVDLVNSCSEILKYISVNFRDNKLSNYIEDLFQFLVTTIAGEFTISDEQYAQYESLNFQDSDEYKVLYIETFLNDLDGSEFNDLIRSIGNSKSKIIADYYAGIPKNPDGGDGNGNEIPETGTIVFTRSANKRVQNGELYIQACGSDNDNEVDGITTGMHLKWALKGELGKKHIPKGDYAKSSSPYATNVGFNNNPDDFIYIYRTVYEDIRYFEIDFTQTLSNVKLTTATNVYPVWNFEINGKVVSLIFIDRGATGTGSYTYAYANNSSNFNFLGDDYYDIINPLNFFNDYKRSFYILIDEQLNDFAFAVEFEAVMNSGSNQSGIFEVSRVSTKSSFYDAINLEYSSAEVSAKQLLEIENPQSGANTITKKIFAENIDKICIRNVLGVITKIRIETYNDFIYSTSPTRQWNFINKFALTIQNAVANNRLDPAGAYQIHKNWPKYNDDVVLNKDNYSDKWGDPDEGLKEAVIKYLENSKDIDNLEAKTELSFSGASINVRMLDILNLLGLDFHNTRMLGFGHIDKTYPDAQKKYVYLAYYKAPALSGISVANNYIEHIFMTLPTGEQDYRLPLTSELNDFTFNFPGDDCSHDQLFDTNGYSYIENDRVININRELLPFEKLYIEDSLDDTENIFSLDKNSKPVFWGVEYKLSTETNFVSPEITNSPPMNSILDGLDAYKDYSSINATTPDVNETIPIAYERKSQIFTHFESTSGNHDYALYGINWFSRASVVSDLKSVETEFINRKIKAPIDVAVQYIQQENPIIFTSQSEQDDYLKSVRVTFNWHYFQNINYQKANKIEFWFREEEPIELQGRIIQIEALTNEKQVKVKTNKFNRVSSNNNEEISPVVINLSAAEKFIGGTLNTNSGKFKIIDVELETGNYPTFTIEKTVHSIELNETTQEQNLEIKFESVCKYDEPKSDEYFTINEDLSNPSSWIKLDKEIYIQNFLSSGEVHYEEFVNDAGKTVRYNVGGIVDNTAKIDLVTTLPAIGAGNPVPVDGVYKIELNSSISLSNIPAGNTSTDEVKFYKGIVRVKTNEDNIRVLDIWRIDSFSPVVLYVYDPEYSATASEYVAIGTSSDKFANFHPGYRVYLDEEVGNNFYDQVLLPSGNDDVKQTLLALRAIDTTVTDPLTSESVKSVFSKPATIIAINKREPVQPNPPNAQSLFATRPDTFGKSSFTIDIETTVEPYAIQYYRANSDAILNKLYTSETVSNLNELLLDLDSNNFQLVFEELANTILNEDLDGYNEYAGFSFPYPNKISFDIGDTLEQKQIKIKKAVDSTFIPLCLKPLIYNFIIADSSGTTSNEVPILKYSNGDFIPPTDTANFKPYPYCIKFNNKVRFTDFSLDGNSRSMYFYYAKGISKELAYSSPSTAIGPIHLVNSTPPKAPKIKKIETVVGNYLIQIRGGFKFYVFAYDEIENVTNYELYRTYNEDNSSNLRLMLLVGTFNADEDIIDQFPLEEIVPVDEPIYYKIVAIKTIKNEFEEDELISSYPSETIKTQLRDFINPNSPEIDPNCTGNTNSSKTLTGVVLGFSKTMYKGSYTLFKMTSSGNWQMVNIDGLTNPILNVDDETDLSFVIGNIDIYDEDDNLIYHRYKIVAENRSGLLSLEDNEFNLTSYFVPSPTIIGPRIATLDQTRTYKMIKTRNSNTIQWKEGTTNLGTDTEQDYSWSSLGTKTVTLVETDPNSGIVTTVTLDVEVKPVPIPEISGDENIWTDTELVYETDEVEGNYYLWNVGDGEIIHGQGTHNITAKWTSTGTQIISVKESNGASSVEDTYNITVFVKPAPNVSGTEEVCLDDPTKDYTLTYDSSNTISVNVTGGNVLSNTNDYPNLQVQWTTEGDGTIELIEGNDAGDLTDTLHIAVKAVPAPQINGNASTALNSNESYNVNLNPGNSYHWNVDLNYGNILSGQDTENIIINWTNSGSTTIEVIEDNGVCAPVPVQLIVIIA